MPAPGFSEDLFDKIVAVHWPGNDDIIALHVDFIYESIKRDSYQIGITATPSTGLASDIENPFPLTDAGGTIPPIIAAWAYPPTLTKTQTTSGGGVTVTDVGNYLPQITYIKNGQQQSTLIAVNPYHTISLPQTIDWTGAHQLGGVTPAEANTILANVAALFAGDFGVTVINSQWILTQSLITHFDPGGTTTNTHIEFKGLMVFDATRIRNLSKNASQLLITLNIQGQLASGDINVTWNTELTTWKKAGKVLPTDGNYHPAWAGTLVSDVLFGHLFDETNKTSFTVTYTVDLKTLHATGTSNG